MGRIIVWLGLIVSAIATIVFSSALILFNRRFPRIGPIIQTMWGGVWCACLGIRIQLLHAERFPDGGCVVAPNHASMFDILVLSALPFHFRWISKQQNGKIPFVGGAMRALGAYFLKRDRSAGDLTVMKEVEEGLRNGERVLIFPEGTRTRTGELLPLKKGAFRTAQNAGAWILPVGIAGTFQIAPPSSTPSRWGHPVAVVFGEPFRIQRSDDLQTWMEHYRLKIEECLAEGRAALAAV